MILILFLNVVTNSHPCNNNQKQTNKCPLNSSHDTTLIKKTCFCCLCLGEGIEELPTDFRSNITISKSVIMDDEVIQLVSMIDDCLFSHLYLMTNNKRIYITQLFSHLYLMTNNKRIYITQVPSGYQCVCGMVEYNNQDNKYNKETQNNISIQ